MDLMLILEGSSAKLWATTSRNICMKLRSTSRAVECASKSSMEADLASAKTKVTFNAKELWI